MKKRRSTTTVTALILGLLVLLAGCSVAPQTVGVDQTSGTRAVINLDNYYSAAAGKTGEDLRSTLKAIISSGHNVPSYTGIWSAYSSSDRTPDGKIWDMYSDNGTGSHPYYSFTYGSDQCGNYSGEGSCYNREHSWPKSWFNEGYPMYSDLVHVVPTDGYVNGRRANWAFGQVGSASWTSQNGSKLGSPDSQMQAWGCTESTVFEPIDAFKGDFARIYFYMVTRYHGTSENGPMSSNFTLKPWAKEMLLAWHQLDPVSSKEISRNDAIYNIQGNRNPFVDNPQWVNAIWGDGTTGGSTGGSTGGTTATTEDFSGCSSTSGSYSSGSFTGTTGISWSYNYTRWDLSIDGKAPAMGRSTAGRITSGTISGGCGTLTFKYKQAFSTGVNFTVYINGSAVKTVNSGYSGTVSVPVNVSGDFTIKFQQNSGGGQVIIDTVSWQAAAAAAGGDESFSACSSTVGYYANGSFTGNDGISWSYNYTRWDLSIDGKAPAMGRSTAGKITSGTISGGCGTLTFKYKQAFSTGVNFDVYVNNSRVKTVSSGYSGTISVPVNVSGSFTLKFEQNSGGGQVIIDTVSWTGN